MNKETYKYIIDIKYDKDLNIYRCEVYYKYHYHIYKVNIRTDTFENAYKSVVIMADKNEKYIKNLKD